MIYYAAPLFTEEERAENYKRAEELRSRGYTVFLPQEAGLITGADSYEERLRLYVRDVESLRNSSVVMAFADRWYDPGTIYETGFAMALNIPVILVSEKLGNNMFINCIHAHTFEEAIELLEHIEKPTRMSRQSSLFTDTNP